MQTFTVIHILKSQIQTLIEDTHKSMTTVEMQVKFKEKLLPFLQANEEIATLSVTKQTVFLPVQLKLVASLDVKKSIGDENDPFYTGLDFLECGRVIAVDNQNSKYVVLNQNLSVANRCTLDNKPLDIAVLSNNQVAITSCGKTISINKIKQNETVIRTQNLVRKEKHFSVTALKNQTLVASTYECEYPATMFSLTGEKTDFDIPFKTRAYKFNESKSTYIESLNMLVVTDRFAHKCYIWNAKYKISAVVEDEQLREPKGVCATTYGLIFVCSSGTNSIVQISPQGKVLGSVKLDKKKSILSGSFSRR